MKMNEFKLNLRNDYVFKVLHHFDEERGKEFFASLVEAVTGEKVTNVRFQPTDLYSFDPQGKNVRFDLCATINTSTAIDLEMQVYQMSGLAERILYYSALQFTTQNNRGVMYNMFMNSKSIFLCQNDVFPNLEHYIHRFMERDDEGRPLTFAMQSHIIEMKKGLKNLQNRINVSDLSLLEKWILFLMCYEENSENLILKQLIESEEIFRKAVEVLQMISQDDKIREQAFARHRFEKDMAQLMADAERIKAEGLIKGREEGRKEGHKEGRKEGLKEGREEGRELEKIAIIRKLIEVGMNDEFILSCTDCSIELLDKIRNNKK